MTTLLVLGAGGEIYREYVLAGLAGAGHRLVLFESPLVEWTRPYVVEQLDTPFTDPRRVIEAAVRCHDRHRFDGVLTYDETKVELAAHLAARLGLRGLDPRCVTRCRDKSAMRAAFAQAQVPSARSVLVHEVAKTLAAAEEIGYPVVLKPRSLAGSIGVVRVDGREELRSAFAVAAGARHPKFADLPGILVEEFLDGPEFSVESVVHDGTVHVCAITEKWVGFPPYFEEVGHLVRPTGSDPRHEAIAATARAAHAALGITVGTTHAELRWTRHGPRMIEVAARMGGDMIPYLVGLASGIDMVAATAAVCAGCPPDVTPRRRRTAAVRLLYPERDGVVVSLGVAAAETSPPWDRIAWEAVPGQRLSLPPRGFMSRLGYVVVVDDTEDGCHRRLEQAVARLRIQMAEDRPAPGRRASGRVTAG